MKYRKFGRTGWMVSEMGYGMWGMAGWTGSDDEEIDIEKDSKAREFVITVNAGKQRTPTFEIDGRTFHCSPFDERKLARELGLEK